MIRFHIGFTRDWTLLLNLCTYHINSELCLTRLLLLFFLFLPFRGCWNNIINIGQIQPCVLGEVRSVFGLYVLSSCRSCTKLEKKKKRIK